MYGRYVHMSPVYVRGTILGTCLLRTLCDGDKVYYTVEPVHWGHSVMGIRCTIQWNLSTGDTP